MTSSAHSQLKQGPETDAQRELARAEADYQRLRQAYLQLTRSEDNDVELAMIGADMERASAALKGLSAPRELPITPEPRLAAPRQARRTAQESA